MNLLSGDDFSKNCRKDIIESDHSSVDGFYKFFIDDKFKLVLIEFKSIDEQTNEHKMKNIKLQLKLKPLETIFCVLPHLIKKNHNVDYGLTYQQLIENHKTYIFVTDYFDKMREHKDIKGDYFDLDKLAPYPINEIQTLTVKAFETFLSKLDS